MSAPAVERLQARISEAVGAEVELERPKDASHGDFATNVALRSAKEVGRPPRELAAELAARIGEVDEVDSTEVAGPGFINLRLADSFFFDALAEVGEGYGGGWVAEPAAHPGRDGVREPDRARSSSRHARNGAYGDSVARLLAFGGHVVEREYYYNDAGAQIDRFRASVDALRRGEPVPEDGYHGDYVRELASAGGRPGAADARVDRAHDRAVPHPLRQLGAAERAREAPARVAAATRHLRAGRRAMGALVRLRRRAGLGADPLGGQGRHADVPRSGRRLSRRQARPRLRQGDLCPRRRSPRDRAVVRRDRADARLRPRPHRGAAVPVRPSHLRRGSARRRRSAPGTSSSSTS